MNNAIDTSTDYTIDEIIDAFLYADNRYPRAHVDAALAMRPEITPRLIALLEDVRRNPTRFADEDGYTGHVFAAMLLAHFRTTRAHQVIVDLFSLPSNLVDALWDDMITEDLPALLYATCGGDLEQIKALASNTKADDYCRSSALTALTYAVVDGVAQREDALAFFGSLLHKDAAAPDSGFWGLLIGAACDLYPQEILPDIRRAFDQDLVDTFTMDYEVVEQSLNDGLEEGLRRIRVDMQRHMPADFHRAMDWWAMFNEEPPKRPPQSMPPAASSVKSLAQGMQNAENLTRQQRRKLERDAAKQAKKKNKRR